MTEELKTLKDFIPENYLSDGEITREQVDRDTRNIIGNELKAEAIKWIKELSSADHNTITNGLAVTEKDFKSYGTEGIIFWIKHFFNISEENLK